MKYITSAIKPRKIMHLSPQSPPAIVQLAGEIVITELFTGLVPSFSTFPLHGQKVTKSSVSTWIMRISKRSNTLWTSKPINDCQWFFFFPVSRFSEAAVRCNSLPVASSYFCRLREWDSTYFPYLGEQFTFKNTIYRQVYGINSIVNGKR